MFKTGREKRESFDYRAGYLKHNNGILGKYYFCSQCYKIVKKSDMEVDHIIPNSRWFAPNRVFNCTSICAKCNKEKSNKMGKYVIKGLLFKFFEEIFLLLNFLIMFSLKTISLLLIYLFEILMKNIKNVNPLMRVVACVTLGSATLIIFNFIG